MLKKTRLYLILSALLAGVLACNLPVGASPAAPPGTTPLDGTALFQTAQAGVVSTLTAMAILSPAQPAYTPTETLTPQPTLTFTPTFTETPSIPTITVSQDTNCRIGPGKVYDYVGALLVGETTEVVGRDPTGDYWYVRNPDKQGGFCWLWGNYASLTGNTQALPVFTPPPTPTPTPDFGVSFTKVDSCVGWYITFSLKNTGGVAFESVSVYIKDTDAPAEASASYDVFEKWNGCLVGTSTDSLTPGQSGHTNSDSLLADPTGHKIKASIKVCTGNGLTGTCITKNLDFKP